MPARIEVAVLNFLSQATGLQAWAGETPRYDPYGLPINPDSVTQPPSWPVLHVELADGSQGRRKDTFEDPFDDTVEIVARCWALGLEEVCRVQDTVEYQLRLTESWRTISDALGTPKYGDRINPYAIIQFDQTGWWRGQEKGLRDARDRLLYRGDLTFAVEIHGALPRQTKPGPQGV